MKKVYYEVLTEERHEFFEEDADAYNLFVDAVNKNIDVAVDKITIIKRLFRKPLMRKECILNYERVGD